MDDQEWAENVVYNLRRIYERIDDHDGALDDLRVGIKEFLDEYNAIKPIPYAKLLELIESFFHAIPTQQWGLIDAVVYKCIPIIGIMNRATWNTFDIKRKQRIMSKLHEWILFSIYEVEKVHVFKREKREQQITDTALGIISRDVAPGYDKGPGQEVRKKILDDKSLDDEQDEDEDEDLNGNNEADPALF